MIVLKIWLGLVLVCSLLVAWRLIGTWLSSVDSYPPEAAEAPDRLVEHFNTTPRDDLDGDVDWHRYEYEMKRKPS